MDIEVLLVELHMAGKVFPGSRQEVHLFLDDKGYDYVGTVGKRRRKFTVSNNRSLSGVDDIFIKKSLSQGKYKFERSIALEFETFSYEGYNNKDEL